MESYSVIYMFSVYVQGVYQKFCTLTINFFITHFTCHLSHAICHMPSVTPIITTWYCANYIQKDLLISFPFQWIFFPGPLAFCKNAVERVNSEKNILNSWVECVEWSGFFRESHMFAHHQIRLNELINMMYFF